MKISCNFVNVYKDSDIMKYKQRNMMQIHIDTIPRSFVIWEKILYHKIRLKMRSNMAT